jgi:phosphatidylserine/phosphatidylglycerophosphate/cardiolipin synthase-like enzyme
MKAAFSNGPLRVRVIAGTRVVLMAWDVDAAARAGLHGFAIKRGVHGGAKPVDWLKGIKYFKDLVPSPARGAEYSSEKHPFQTFLWSDYAADPGTAYDFTLVALYGAIGALEKRYTIDFTVTTEKEIDKGHGIWFNRGAIASHFLSTEFQNKHITNEMFNKVDANGQITDREVKWLSRGLAEACIAFINGLKSGEGLRVCAYEFTYLPVLKAYKRALDRGVDVRIIYHAADAADTAIGEAGIPKVKGGRTILTQRTRPPIPHNKFMVKLVSGKAREVWTGSTNFTDTGFFGQTNVGHLVQDSETAALYLKYWDELENNPAHTEALTNAVKLTPNPSNVVPKSSITAFYSPRVADNMLDWYAQRIGDGAALVTMTIPFNVAPAILKGFDQTLGSMRLIILEDVPDNEIIQAEIRNKPRLVFSNGEILGKTFIKYKTGPGGAKVVPIAHSNLERWFVEEELARPINKGHVFFVHSKILVIDPLSDDPLVCTGSANFSKGSLITNDENMLLIRGDTRVADIYLTEFDRIFRHFYTRDAINRFAKRGDGRNPLELDTSSAWIEPNFKDGTYKNSRRLMFFPPAGAPTKTWSEKAAADTDPFADEPARAEAERKKKADKAKARRAKAKAAVTPRGRRKKATTARAVKTPKKSAKSARKSGKRRVHA